MRELIAAFGDHANSDALGIVLAGNGPVFSAGHDFADVAGGGAGARAGHRDRRQLDVSADPAVANEDVGFAAPGGKGGWFCHTPMVAEKRKPRWRHGR